MLGRSVCHPVCFGAHCSRRPDQWSPGHVCWWFASRMHWFSFCTYALPPLPSSLLRLPSAPQALVMTCAPRTLHLCFALSCRKDGRTDVRNDNIDETELGLVMIKPAPAGEPLPEMYGTVNKAENEAQVCKCGCAACEHVQPLWQYVLGNSSSRRASLRVSLMAGCLSRTLVSAQCMCVCCKLPGHHGR